MAAVTPSAAVSTRPAGRERRARLLAAALDLFTERGYHETSVDAVVARARTSKSAFYAHFASKEACFRDLLEEEGGALVAAVRAQIAATGGRPRDRLGAGVAQFVHSCFEHAPAARLLVVQSVGLAESIEAERERLHGLFAAIAAAEVIAGQAEGDFAGLSAGVYGRALVGAVEQVTARALAGPVAPDPAELVVELRRIFAL